MEILNQAFVVSGGASGLGLATVEMIIDNGGYCLILDTHVDKGKQVEAQWPQAVLFVKTDITSETDVKNAIALGKEKFHSFSGLINCAGIGPAKRVLGKEGVHGLDDFVHVLNVNLVGSFNTLRLVAAEIEKQNSPGIIINTASMAAFEGQIGQAAYAASKGGIVSMTLPLARELARCRIRVMTVAPGIFETPLLANLPTEVQTSLASQIPYPKRFGKPVEYASLVKQIIENDMLNAEVIRLDGGIRMGAK